MILKLQTLVQASSVLLVTIKHGKETVDWKKENLCSPGAKLKKSIFFNLLNTKMLIIHDLNFSQTIVKHSLR